MGAERTVWHVAGSPSDAPGGDQVTPLANTQIVDALHRLTADSAEQRAAVAAEQGLGYRPGAVRTVELGGGRLRIGHAAIIARRS